MNPNTQLTIELNKDIFTTGGMISGILIYRADAARSVESIGVSVSGFEAAAGVSFAQALRRNEPFFEREETLSGCEQPRGCVPRLSRIWNAILGRYSGRRIVPGEHVYPFSIQLPASLPPSYDGRAGKIEYRVSGIAKYSASGFVKTDKIVNIALVPKSKIGRAVSITHPDPKAQKHPSEVSMRVDLARRSVEVGGALSGSVEIFNPKGVDIRRMVIQLESCEGTRGTCAVARDIADERIIESPDSTVNFDLNLPKNAPPTVEGTEVSVVWFLKIHLQTDPSLDFSTPITVFGLI